MNIVLRTSTFLLLLSTVALHAQTNTRLTELIAYPVFVTTEDHEPDRFLEFIEPGPREAWLAALLTSVRSGATPAYDGNRGPSPGAQLTLQDLAGILNRKDTVYLAKEGGKPDTFVMDKSIQPSDIVQIFFQESWTTSPEFGLTKKVLAYAPAIAMYRDDGKLMGHRRLFWVKMQP